MFKQFVDGWAEFVVEKRIWVLLVSLVVAVMVLLPMKNLYFDNSNDMWFLKNDPTLTAYDDLLGYFGDNEYFLIGIEAKPGETVFTKDYIQLTYELTEYLQDNDFLKDLQFSKLTRSRNVEKFAVEPMQDDTLLGAGDDFDASGFGETPDEAGETPVVQRSHPIRAVTKLQSLVTYQVTKADGDNLDVIDLFPESQSDFTGSDEELQKAAALMKGEDLALGALVSEDFKHALISARTTYLKGTVDHHVKLVDQVKAFVKEKGYEKQGFVFHFTGNPEISANFFEASMADQGLTIPLMFLLIILVLVTSFRTISGLMMPLLVIVGSVFITLGFMGSLGWALNMLNVTLPVILMAVGIGDSVHLLVEFYHLRSKGFDSKEAAKEAVRQLYVPCMNTSITTALGFLSIGFSKLGPLREFGLIAAFGVVAAFLITVTLLPALVSFTKGKESKQQETSEEGWIALITGNLTDFTYRFSRPIAFGGLVVTLVSVFFMSKVEVNANFVDYFKPDTQMRMDLDYFNENYNGGFFLEFILDSGEEKGVLDPKFLSRAKKLQVWLQSLDKTGKATSMVDMLETFNKAMHGDDPAFKVLPDSRELVAQYLLLYSNSSPTEDLTDLKTFDERRMRISLRLVNQPTKQTKKFVEMIQQTIDKDYPDLHVTITGMPVLYNNMDTYILEGIVTSFSLAFISIFLCFIVLLRSVKYGLLAVIPSLFPILLAGGIMGLMGINLNLAAMIIASVTFGIAVDDTIHIMSRYIKVRQSGKSRKEAVHASVSETGKAITYTTVILFFGFSILMVSTFVPNIQLGFFGAVILAVALIASLTLLPAVMFLQKSESAS